MTFHSIPAAVLTEDRIEETSWRLGEMHNVCMGVPLCVNYNRREWNCVLDFSNTFLGYKRHNSSPIAYLDATRAEL